MPSDDTPQGGDSSTDARVAWIAARQHRVHHGVYAVWRDGSRAAITTDGVLRRGVPGIETHVGRIRPGDTLVVDGIRVTKVARTLLDLAEVLTLDQLVQAIDNATNNRHLRPTLMSSMIKQSHGRRGLKPLRQALLITKPACQSPRSTNAFTDTRSTSSGATNAWTTARFTWRQVVNDEPWVVERLTDFLA